MTTSTPHATRQRRRPAPPPAPAPWTCENCAHENVGRRRRCRDCGTSRH